MVVKLVVILLIVIFGLLILLAPLVDRLQQLGIIESPPTPTRAEREAVARETATAARERTAVARTRVAEDRTAEARDNVETDQFECLSVWDGSYPSFNELIKDVLKDPDSFEDIETRVTAFDGDGWQNIRVRYRARNSFGGFVVSTAEGIGSTDCDPVLIDAG